MGVTVGFDVYGTLIDTHGVIEKLSETLGDSATAFSQTWRDKQLEYSFRRGLMKRYENFVVCTRQALDYTSTYFNAGFSDEQKQQLLETYRVLPAFSDARSGLERLKKSGARIYAFSNGTADAVETLLVNAGISEYFIDIVSVDEICSFKPDPGVYQHFLQRSDADINDAWLISSNPFDVLGAISAGMKAAWVRRSEQAVLDPWEIEPTITVSNLDELGEKLVPA
jgi:2-haloacid dehalogenase